MRRVRRLLWVPTCVRTGAVCALLCLAGVALPRAAHADSALEELLAAGVERPAYLGRFNHASAAEIAALIAIQQRQAAPRHVRLRALSALAQSGHADAQAFLRGLVRDAKLTPNGDDVLHPARSVPVLTRALLGLRMAPQAVAPESLAFCLAHAHPAIRQAAVALLAAQRTTRADALLEKQRTREQSPRVQRALNAAVRKP